MNCIDFVSRITDLLKQKGITKSRFYSDLDIANNSLTRWKTFTPNVDVAVRIAEYLNTTVEYLVKGEEDELPKHIIDIAYEIQNLPPILRNVVLATLESCKNQQSIQDAEKAYGA